MLSELCLTMTLFFMPTKDIPPASDSPFCRSFTQDVFKMVYGTIDSALLTKLSGTCTTWDSASEEDKTAVYHFSMLCDSNGSFCGADKYEEYWALTNQVAALLGIERIVGFKSWAVTDNIMRSRISHELLRALLHYIATKCLGIDDTPPHIRSQVYKWLIKACSYICSDINIQSNNKLTHSLTYYALGFKIPEDRRDRLRKCLERISDKSSGPLPTRAGSFERYMFEMLYGTIDPKLLADLSRTCASWDSASIMDRVRVHDFAILCKKSGSFCGADQMTEYRPLSDRVAEILGIDEVLKFEQLKTILSLYCSQISDDLLYSILRHIAAQYLANGDVPSDMRGMVYTYFHKASYRGIISLEKEFMVAALGFASGWTFSEAERNALHAGFEEILGGRD